MADPLSSPLFTPVVFGPLTVANRFIRSAAFEGMSQHSEPTEALVNYHRSVAAGGVGMTTVAYAAVSDHGRTFGHQLWMRQEIVPGLRALTDAVHAEGAAVAVQLGHGGNMADANVTGVRPMAPSRVFTLFGLVMPRAMTEQDIDDLVEDFARSTALARSAGFDAVEVQVGHGYLISQFLSPHTNRRDDRWGGSRHNRARLARQVVRAVRRAAGPNMAVLAKTNLLDGFNGGMTAEEGREVATMLEHEGVDGLVLSGGFVSKNPFFLMRGDIPLRQMITTQRQVARKVGLALFGKVMVHAYPFTEAFFLDEAVKMRRAVDLPLVLVGGLRTKDTMERALDLGFNAIALARPLIREPDFVNKLRDGTATESKCQPCNKCVASMYFDEARCPDLEEERKTGGQ